MHDGNVLCDPTYGKMHDGTIQRAHLVKKEEAGWHRTAVSSSSHLFSF